MAVNNKDIVLKELKKELSNEKMMLRKYNKWFKKIDPNDYNEMAYETALQTQRNFEDKIKILETQIKGLKNE